MTVVSQSINSAPKEKRHSELKSNSFKIRRLKTVFKMLTGKETVQNSYSEINAISQK
jgi:hypothetical protein